MADTYETGADEIGRVAQAMAEVVGREQAHRRKRERECV